MTQLAFDPDAERAFLDSLVSDYTDVSPYSQAKKDVILELIERYLGDGAGRVGLQLGCANGYETQRLAGALDQLTVVDGSAVFVERLAAANRQPDLTFVCSLFEDLDPADHPGGYTDVFCSYVLEHVYDPRQVLTTVRGLIRPGGRLFVVVPNHLALSRQLAQAMGLLDRLEDLTENDLRHGHRRVYDRESLVADVEASGYSVVAVHGVVLKILADFQLNRLLGDGFLTADHVEGLQRLAERSPEFARLSDSIFLVATPAG